MCGIFCCFCKAEAGDSKIELTSKIKSSLIRRGPNCYNESKFCTPFWRTNFFASVLWLQGLKITDQPFTDDDNNILLWNGDIFGGLICEGGESDTKLLSRKLQEALKHQDSRKKICEILGSIEGPWSIIYWVEREQELWFGRDFLGRHSLLWSVVPGESLTLASSGERNVPLKEVPAVGLFVATFKEDAFNLKLYPWRNVKVTDAVHKLEEANICSFVSINEESVPHCNYTKSCQTLPEENDSFVSFVKNINLESSNFQTTTFFQKLLSDQDVALRVEKLICELKAAVDIRCNLQPPLCKKCASAFISDNCDHSKVAVLFSGGLDSAVIAALAHECIPKTHSIDLINVAFTYSNNSSDKLTLNNGDAQFETNKNFDTPDRITGKATFSELSKLFPDRTWNFIEVNVTKEELQKMRDETIADLIYPLNSILDDSLGCALWFAARGKGIKHNANSCVEENYMSPANILLLGMGADELLGGYSKYSKSFSSSEDWSTVVKLLEYDLALIPYRNLGRDDRVVSDSGRQARFPFLAENFVRFVTSLPAHQRTAPFKFLPKGIGEKLILRLAAFSLGLLVPSVAPKRALQFGSKIAGLEGKKEQGHEVCSRLLIKSHEM